MRNHRTRMVTLANLSVQSRHQVLRMALSIAIGLILATILIVSTSERPFTSLNYFFFAPIQKVSYLNFWIQKAVPLMFTGVAVCIMFSANQFNLAMEGSFLMGGFIGGALTNIYIFPNNHLLGIIFGCIIGGLVGSVVTAIPAILQKLFNASVMVTSLMMNYICLWYSCFLLFSVFKDPKTSKGTYSWTESGEEIMVARLKVGNDKLLIFYSLFVALLIVLFAWFLLYRTKFGFKLRTVGQNGHFAKYVGISVSGIAILSQIIGGFIGGVGGACEIMSLYTNYRWVELTGYGWDGVTMAVFAKNNPRNVPIAALFISYLRAGAYVMSIKTGIQVDMTNVVEGVIILFLLAEKFLSGTYRKMIIKEAEREKALQMAQQGGEQ
ncbi:MAG: ABC transporter permease [Erysipelotrichaceae bacterium]|nr:ABC transporter permease [Erysipelotrichaceae bacterium]